MSCRSEQRTIVKQSVSLALVVAMWANFVCVASYAQESFTARSNTDAKTKPRLTAKSAAAVTTAPTEAVTRKAPAPLQRIALNEAYGKLPLRFEINQGQTDSQVKFLARGSGYNLFLTPSESVMVLSRPSSARSQGRNARVKPSLKSFGVSSVMRTKLVGARANPDVSGLEELPGKTNYLIGNDPRNGERAFQALRE